MRNETLVLILLINQSTETNLQATVRDIPHRVLEGPDNGIHDELELRWWNAQKSVEALAIHGLRK